MLTLRQRVSDAIRSRREFLGLSQADLANRLEVSQQFVSRLENGRHNTTMRTLDRVAEALDADLVMNFHKAPTR